MKLEKLFEIKKGRKPGELSGERANGQARFIQIEDLRGDSNLKYCDLTDDDVTCTERDLLIVWDGAYSGLVSHGLSGAFGSTLARLRPITDAVCSSYVARYLQSQLAEIQRNRTGATIPHVNGKHLRNIDVPLPTLAEQKRIAGILDAADALRAKRRESLAQLDTLIQAIFLDMFGDPVANPKGWETLSLGEMEASGLLKLGRGKVISKKDIAADPGDYPIYSSARLNNGEFGRYAKYMFDQEMITWSVDGGGNFFYRPKHRFSVTNVGGTLSVERPDILDYRFLFTALDLQHGSLKFDWTDKAHPSVIRRVYEAVPLPPLDEQKRFRRMLGAIDRQREGLGRHLVELSVLFQSLQSAAFMGEL